MRNHEYNEAYVKSTKEQVEELGKLLPPVQVAEIALGQMKELLHRALDAGVSGCAVVDVYDIPNPAPENANTKMELALSSMYRLAEDIKDVCDAYDKRMKELLEYAETLPDTENGTFDQDAKITEFMVRGETQAGDVLH